MEKVGCCVLLGMGAGATAYIAYHSGINALNPVMLNSNRLEG